MHTYITQISGSLRGDDDMDQLGSVSTVLEGTGCDGSVGGGYGHIRTTTAGGTAAVRSLYIQTDRQT